MKRAVLLINLGTPAQPEPKEVRRFLRQFLNDPKVIDIHWLLRKILVNWVIIPFRTKKSTKLYRRLWNDRGSPIAYYLKSLGNQLQTQHPNQADYYVAMRYGEPAIETILDHLNQKEYNSLQIIPLFPQYAESTTGSVIDRCKHLLTQFPNIKNVTYLSHFYHERWFIEAFTQKINAYKPHTFDHILFSYHSLPLKHIEKQHPNQRSEQCVCEQQMPPFGSTCYKAQCYETTRKLIHSLQMHHMQHSVAFQSRFSKRWIGPYTDQVITELALAGKKRILVVAPSFVADCLETIVEIQQDYAHLFKSSGGEELVLVESLNDEPHWVETLGKLSEMVPCPDVTETCNLV